MKTTKIIFAGLAVLFMVFMTACSDDPQSSEDKANPKNFVKKGKIVQGEIDYNVLSRYSTALKDATYSLKNSNWYAVKNERWTNIDGGILGDSPLPSTIILKEGTCWESMKLFRSSSGPSKFAVVLDLIYRTDGKDYKVFIKKDISIDETTSTITLGSSKFYLLLADEMNLVIYPDYNKAYDEGDGCYVPIGNYSTSEPFEIKGRPVAFDSTKDAYDWIIDAFRDKFGESVDRNKYYQGEIVLEQPMLYLSDLISERDYYVSLEDGE